MREDAVIRLHLFEAIKQFLLKHVGRLFPFPIEEQLEQDLWQREIPYNVRRRLLQSGLRAIVYAEDAPLERSDV